MCNADSITVSKDEGGICRGGLLTERANVGGGLMSEGANDVYPLYTYLSFSPLSTL